MKSIRRHAAIAAMVITFGAGVFSAAQTAAPAQRAFASPEAAVVALRAAVEIHDKAALRDIFGPDMHDLLTGDDSQDKANSRKFAKAMAEGVSPLTESDGTVTLEIGSHKWPFPIPLVKSGAAWRFDTALGKDEIANRHIGKDEFHAIGACEAYLPAQKKYVTGGRGSSGSIRYARKLMSSPGKMDGLYWKTELSDPTSPFGLKMAAAGVDGNPAPKPFHGYFFKILPRQDAAVPTFVAYPDHWGRSGVMTFVMNHDGKIYQRDLGEKTTELAAVMTEYDSSSGDWSLVKDQGILEE